MAAVDNYLQLRIAITENVDIQHIQEVGGFCPLCGKQGGIIQLISIANNKEFYYKTGVSRIKYL